MNTLQLECMIHCDLMLGPNVLGVYAADQLPNIIPKQPYGFIANTQGHSFPGEHWCAIYDDGHGHIQFFDSYGRPPRENSVFFQQWINKNAKTVRTNDVKIQSDESTVCGLYCILFLRIMMTGSTMKEFVDLFDSSDTFENDIYVARVLSGAYSDCCVNSCGQTCTYLCKRI
jgi:hypothetical protein